jgi:LmbE family N-acetylglucosaminyl deacetylase
VDRNLGGQYTAAPVESKAFTWRSPISTLLFRQTHVKFTAPLSRVLLVCPHPDDETIAAGLLLQEAASRGGAMRVVYLTDGERNPIPQFLLERHWPWRSVDRTRWGRRRREEARAALQTLGVNPECAEFWALPDQGVRRFVQSVAVVERLSRLIATFQPTVVIAPSIHDLHPDHSAASVIARRALSMAGLRAMHLVYLVHGSLPEPLPVCAPPATPARQFRKAAAMECHQSQLAASSRRMMELARRPESFAAWEDDAPLPSASFRPLRRAVHVVGGTRGIHVRAKR